MTPPTCSELSHQHSEPIAGTAMTLITRWVALEVRAPWTQKGFPDCDLPSALFATLTHLNDNIEGTRILFIRRPQTAPETPLSLFLGLSGDPSPALFQFQAPSLSDFESIDIEGILTGATPAPEAQLSDPIHLVCAHGKRDPCCARWGVALYKAMAALSPDNVWQASHLQGHRFAATMVTLPLGLQYGRLRAQDAAPLLSAHTAGALYRLDRFRGRTCYSAPTQAAASLLRAQTGHMELGALRHIETNADGETFTGRFEIDGAPHTASVTRRLTEQKWKLSCNKEKLSAAVVFDPVPSTRPAR